VTLLEALILGLVQGLTEFLPISSSGHLALGSQLLGWTDADANLAFNIAVHFGSLVAVLVFVRTEIVAMFTTRPRLMLVLAAATLPLVVVVLATPAKEVVKDLSSSMVAVGACLLATALVLALVRRMAGGDDESDLSLPRSFLVGCAQVFAILPGVSRSGVTLAAGLRAGLKREQAIRFAFLMAVPAIGGAFLFMLMDGGLSGDLDYAPMAAGATVSFVTSLFAMRMLVALRNRLGWFALYCAAVGGVALAAGSW
jgi:undecaprenyl-diphosphatase